MHPLVRDLYKRALLVGTDYPHPRGLEYVREQWKRGLRETIIPTSSSAAAQRRGTVDDDEQQKQQGREIQKAVGRGRYAIREMVGVIQLKKYRTMRRRYGEGAELDVESEVHRIRSACTELSRKDDGTGAASTAAGGVGDSNDRTT
mmetsp:Transcript_15029/g.17799  ORF Transcript_15029/g.17799 Transcript_15029/m.17799 type:complete len:146 (+) Transcript_15029:74-511(+)